MSGHAPVLLDDVLAMLAPQDGGRYCDGTFGGGGYTEAILGAAHCTVYAIDRDPAAIRRGAALAARYADRLHLIEGRFGDLLAAMQAEGVGTLDGVVLDLGVSSYQLDEAERGFSFRFDGPLDMRMERDGRSAADLVNTLAEGDLAQLLLTFGEERHAKRIARAIVAARREAPITTTLRLAELIRSVTPRDPSGIDRATRSFQALRIAVNDELGEIERGLAAAMTLLGPGGRLVVVAFHSLEDRLVKRCMAAAAGRGGGASRHDPAALAGPGAPPAFRLLTPRAIRPGSAEAERNPRARSGRLRALERLSFRDAA